MSAACIRSAAIFMAVTLALLGSSWYFSDENYNTDSIDVSALPPAFTLNYITIPYNVAENNNLESVFGQWSIAHGKRYASEQEYAMRLKNFRKSVEEIRAHKESRNSEYELGLTAYADMTHEEFMSHFRINEAQRAMEEDCSATERKLGSGKLPEVNLPIKIDWREHKGVGPVKNQGQCGSCWTFSSTGAIEAHLLLKTKRYVSLSEQELLDCAGNYDNQGCNGGLPSHAFQYIIENGGLSTDAAYPYEAKDTNGCRADKSKHMGHRPIKLRSSFNITQYDERELEVAVGSVGPVSVAFQVAGDFRLYKSGVYSSKECKNKAHDVNHAVLAVGYDTSAEGTPYWIIKNSWGAAWGEQGYFKMKRGVNMCGIAVCNSFPILA